MEHTSNTERISNTPNQPGIILLQRVSSTETNPQPEEDNSPAPETPTTNSNSGPIDDIILNALQSPRDRLMLFKLDLELESFLQDSRVSRLDFPPMLSYQRLIVHRVAQYFKLDHAVIGPPGPKRSLSLFKNPSSQVPILRFTDLVEQEEEPVKNTSVKILARKPIQRNSNPNPNPNPNNPDTTTGNLPEKDHSSSSSTEFRPTIMTKSLEEREEDYAKARARIFSDFESPSNDDSSQEDNPSESAQKTATDLPVSSSNDEKGTLSKGSSTTPKREKSSPEPVLQENEPSKTMISSFKSLAVNSEPNLKWNVHTHRVVDSSENRDSDRTSEHHHESPSPASSSSHQRDSVSDSSIPNQPQGQSMGYFSSPHSQIYHPSPPIMYHHHHPHWNPPGPPTMIPGVGNVPYDPSHPPPPPMWAIPPGMTHFPHPPPPSSSSHPNEDISSLKSHSDPTLNFQSFPHIPPPPHMFADGMGYPPPGRPGGPAYVRGPTWSNPPSTKPRSPPMDRINEFSNTSSNVNGFDQAQRSHMPYVPTYSMGKGNEFPPHQIFVPPFSNPPPPPIPYGMGAPPTANIYPHSSSDRTGGKPLHLYNPNSSSSNASPQEYMGGPVPNLNFYAPIPPPGPHLYPPPPPPGFIHPGSFGGSTVDMSGQGQRPTRQKFESSSSAKGYNKNKNLQYDYSVPSYSSTDSFGPTTESSSGSTATPPAHILQVRTLKNLPLTDGCFDELRSSGATLKALKDPEPVIIAIFKTSAAAKSALNSVSSESFELHPWLQNIV